MNRIYRLIWSDAAQTWVVTHEHAKSRGKRNGGASGALLLAGALLAPLALAAPPAPPAPNALPTGGQVAAGQAAISQAGSTMTIQQATDKAILNWQSFNIGANATVNFQQPGAGSVALNRVLGSDPSAIYGNLNANGQVFLINPNGVLFAPGARVDVAGLVASTMNIRNEDFLAGNYRFTRDGATGSVVNQGSLAAQYVAMLAPEVRNEGIIAARMGTAALAAGDAVTLGITGQRLVDVLVDKATINTLVENRQLVQVDGGTVIMSAQSANELLGRTVNSGTVEAKGIVADGGTVRLTASHAVEHSGTISADAGANGKGGTVLVIADLANPASRTDISGTISAKGGTQSGDGGFIETSATRLKIADSARIDTSAPFGATGQWLLDPYDFTIAAANGDITGTALGAALASNNVTIQTADTAVSCTNVTCGTGNSSGNGDIFVNDSVSWNSDKKLTLSAWRNVHINAPISVNGAGGGLALEFAQSDVEFNFPAGIYTVNAPVNLAAGTSFSTKAASDGIPVNYTVINNAAGLANIASNLAGHYVLGNDVATSGEWTPIGSFADPYVGLFDGLGHKVTGLIHTNAGADVDVGLFGVSNSLIQNVGVTGVNISGSQNVGALVGTNNGFVVNSYATGTVQGTGSGDVGRIGGLVGYSMGPIQSSYANVTVTATSGNQTNDPMFMEDPLSTGRGGIGGLAGVVGTSVTDSYARGNVTGKNAVGGLVGFSGASISSSYSTGLVTRSSGTSTNIGGFVGEMMSLPFPMPFIFNSFWDTTTSGQASGGSAADAVPGGLVGRTTTQMQTPSTFGTWDTSVAWELRSGQYPLLKQMLQPIFVIADNNTASYTGSAFTAFTSTVSPTTAPGGAYTGTVTYTPSTASPTNAGSYTVTPGGVSVTAPADQQGYRVEFVDGTLTITPAVLTTTITGTLVGSVSKVYDGSSTITGLTNANFSLSGWQGSDGATVSKTTGTVTDGPNAGASATRPVTVTLDTGDYSPTGSTSLSNYTLPTSVSGNIGEITPRTVTLSAAKTYDGTTALTGSQVTIGNLVSGESLAHTGTTASSKNVADNATNFINAITLQDGSGGLASNYRSPALSAANAPVTIDKKTVSLSASRTYDGTTTLGSSDVTVGTGVSGESLGYSGATANSKNVADNATNFISAITLQDGTGGLTSNYQLPALDQANAPVTLSPSTITVSWKAGETVSKVYDGDTATGRIESKFDVTGLFDFYIPTISGEFGITGTFDTKDAGTGKAVTASFANWAVPTILNGAPVSFPAVDPANYIAPSTLAIPGVGEITRRPITANLTGTISKTYDGTTDAAVGFLNYSYNTANFVAGEGAFLGGTNSWQAGTFDTRHAGTGKTVTVNINPADYVPIGSTNINNYRFVDQTTGVENQVTGTVGTITQKAVTLTAPNVSKTYDGGLTYTTVAGDLTTLSTQLGVSGDAVTAATIAYTDKNAGTGNKAVNFNAATINDGNDGNNYAVTLAGNNTSTINKKDITITVSGTTSKFYDGNTSAAVSAGNFDGTGFISGEGVLLPVGTYDSGTNSYPGTFDDKNAGNRTITIPLSGWAPFLGTPDPNNYNLPSSTTASGVITPKPLTVSGTTVADRVYNGSDVAAVALGTLSGFVGSETVTATVSGIFDSKNAGNRTATASYTLADGSNGGLASNYVAEATTHAAVITPKALTVSGTAASDRAFDGTTNATITTGSLSGFVGLETVTATATGQFDSKNAGSRTATATYTLTDGTSGGLATNYSLADTTGHAATITAKTVSLAASRVYDGSAILTGSDVSITTGVTGEALTYSGATANSKNVGTGNFITAITLQDGSGGLAANYLLPALDNVNAPVTITPQTLTVSGTTAAGKVYDGLAAAAMTVGTLSGFVATETVTATASGVFDNKNVGNRTATAAYTLLDGANGGLASNYVLADTTGHAATITQKELAVSGTTAASRTYDGTINVAVTMGTLSGLVGTETVSAAAAGAFDSRNAGARTATVTYTLANGSNGGLASNYSLPATTHAATINPRAATLTVPVISKVYDGNTGYSGAIDLAPLTAALGITGDSVTGITFTYTDKNAGTGNKTVNASAAVISDGNGGNNYNVTYAGNSTSTITPKALTISGTTAAGKVYDGTNQAVITLGTLAGLVGSEQLGTTATGVFDSKDAGARTATATYTLADGAGGGSASNYTLASTSVHAATITPKVLTVSGSTAASRTYDGTTNATITVGTLSGFVGTETVTATATGVFDSRNVGARTATATYTLGNASGLAGNYTLANTTGHSATISPKPLNVTGLSVPNRFIDLGNDPIFSGTPSPSGVVTHIEGSSSVLDDVTVAGTPVGSFSSFETLKPLTVTITPGSLTLQGTDAGNYSIVLPVLTTALLPRDIGILALSSATAASQGAYTSVLGGISFVDSGGSWHSNGRIRLNQLNESVRLYKLADNDRGRTEGLASVQKALDALKMEFNIQLARACSSCTFSDADWTAYMNRLVKSK